MSAARDEPLDYRWARIRPCRASPSHLASMAPEHPDSFSRSTDLPVFRLPVLKLAVQGRYNQGIAERPLPRSYNIIQPVSALSRRKRGFKSRRGHKWSKILF